MATKYFRAENANRRIAGVNFDLVDVVCGTVIGVLAAEDPLASEVETIAGNPANAVEEISEEQYLAALQKKIPSLASSPASSPPSSPSPAPVKGTGQVVVQDGSPEPVAERVLEKAEDAITLGPVKTEVLPEAPPKKGKNK